MEKNGRLFCCISTYFRGCNGKGDLLTRHARNFIYSTHIIIGKKILRNFTKVLRNFAKVPYIISAKNCSILVEPACGKARHSCYNFCSVYVRALVPVCMHPSRFVWTITSTFLHGFQIFCHSRYP